MTHVSLLQKTSMVRKTLDMDSQYGRSLAILIA